MPRQNVLTPLPSAKQHKLKWWRKGANLHGIALEGHYEAIASSMDLVRTLPPDEMYKRRRFIMHN